MTAVDPAERTALAAEYVIGSLPDTERVTFEQALVREFDLQREVYYWQDRLLPMTRVLPPVDPSAGLWPRIEKSLSARTAQSRVADAGISWWQGLTFWRFGAVAAALLAVFLGVRLLVPAATAPEGGRYYAVLQSPDRKDAGWIVEAAAGGKLRLVPLATTTVAPGKSLQFWTKPQGANAPTSLGLVPPNRVTEIDIARLPAMEGEQLFELTLEPEGGSTIGRPTGPILYVGRAVTLASR